eukprot:CAMPEP_0179064556 /NCGR_PEP_ID=MMETSP0796-20121207/28008_1 /TAXON_ID=73915 /ORGANISM="Pyrodinium bahamense, Strain pbaha01" /LENGTH=227 /DNA_ID=CAMNT_0020761505 /DNA_START=80 /DNA_END=763 /DNA_ORIENTATION=+
MADEEWKAATLSKHNELRANHGAPLLEWSDDCYEQALAQAMECESAETLFHGKQEGSLGHHGQNAYFYSGDAVAEDAVQSWYDEISSPGYDFSSPGNQPGTGHFTQVVWVESQFVGMARSPNGHFVVANYFPAGNMIMPGMFEKNVLPPGADMASRPPPAAEGQVVATEWNDEVEAAVAGCPFDQFIDAIKQGFSDGAKVTINRQAASIEIIVEKDGCMSSQSGSWG